MSSSSAPHLSVLLFFVLWSTSVLTFPIHTEGSGDEPELIFPTVRSTHAPPLATPSALPSPSSTPLPDITATFIRIKDFLFHRTVDFLRDNMLLILVIMSLLVVIVFIACCASAMSHKRKLEAYYPPKRHLPKRNVNAPAPTHARAQTEPQGGACVSAGYHRAPTKALVGEKDGVDPRPKPKEVQTAEDVEEVEVQKEENGKPKPSTSTGVKSDPGLVCTCHLKKVKQTSH